MLSFHKHKEAGSLHEVISKDWEEILDEIFRKIVSTHNACIAVSSNTIKSNDDDKIGISSEEIVYRFHKRVDQKTHDIVYKIKKDIFNELFEFYYKHKDNNKYDFYHVGKKNKLSLDLLVYPIHQSIQKKAFLILQYQVEQTVLDRICGELIEILA